MKRILITGGNGYVAKALHQSLKDIYHVTVLSRNHFDLRHSHSMFTWFKYTPRFDAVIHTAAMGVSRLAKDDFSIADDNLQIYYNLLQNQYRYDKFIHFGSGAELFYKDTFYGLSKHVIRNSILNKENFYNIRIFSVFDENELDTRFIKANILRYIRKESMEIYNNKFMDFFYMQDLVNLVRFYIENDSLQKEIDCSYNEKYTLLDIANIINSLSDNKVDIVTHSSEMGDPYVGKSELPIKHIGLLEGINNVYNKLLSNP